MNEADIYEKIKSIVVDNLGIDEREVSREVSFKDLGADSLDAIELLMALEGAFGIEIESGNEDKLQTVGDAVKFVLRIKNA